MEDIINEFPAANVALEIDGPPAYVGRRVILTGNPDGFRLLAKVLTEMADAVADPDPDRPQHIGWHLLVNTECIPALQMDADLFLSLNCEPKPD